MYEVNSQGILLCKTPVMLGQYLSHLWRKQLGHSFEGHVDSGHKRGGHPRKFSLEQQLFQLSPAGEDTCNLQLRRQAQHFQHCLAKTLPQMCLSCSNRALWMQDMQDQVIRRLQNNHQSFLWFSCVTVCSKVVVWDFFSQVFWWSGMTRQVPDFLLSTVPFCGYTSYQWKLLSENRINGRSRRYLWILQPIHCLFLESTFCGGTGNQTKLIPLVREEN